ncbi:hypothetical protein SAMN05421854_102566 [Amycolatopsis rubida]|uniref:Uncharacterized protein n=1 Tax=Amycolatopsis rubida TaxID=112413 RepID=A0A1I5IN25_9PSEU|nr:hypothetical protein SAMN05421854_102566 [Amycolatopsis rubida]
MQARYPIRVNHVPGPEGNALSRGRAGRTGPAAAPSGSPRPGSRPSVSPAAKGVLGACLRRLSWSPDRLAREINRRLGPGTISAKAPYHWLRGVTPRDPLPAVVVSILSAELGEEIRLANLWPALAARDVCPPAPAPVTVEPLMIRALRSRVDQLLALDGRLDDRALLSWAAQDVSWIRQLSAGPGVPAAAERELRRMAADLSRVIGNVSLRIDDCVGGCDFLLASIEECETIV